jgi:3-deoxy-manno-octulosonate cytidylyltransferase (CMP-KDO synthetase)
MMNHDRPRHALISPHRTLAIIPARTASQRLPGKLLLRVSGKSILQHTYEAAKRAESLDQVTIAAADPAIAQEARSFGATVVMTDPDLPSGTDRVAAVARSQTNADLIVNIQGDEPELEPSTIDAAVCALRSSPLSPMATLAAPIRNQRDLEDPACVKVVFNDQGQALYFSRSPIPYPRDGVTDADFDGPPRFFQHLGLYVYRRAFLLRLASLPAASLEQTEKLEQLRVLAAGETIQVVVVNHAARGIDTVADYRQFVTRMSA